MDSKSDKLELDSRDCFFTLSDYFQMSCMHYILTHNLYKKSVEGNGPTKKAKTASLNENVPAKKAKIADGDSQGNAAYEGLFSPPRPVETGKPLATLSIFDHKLYLDLKAKYASGMKIVGTAAEKQDLEILADLEKKVQNERSKVNDYLYYNACTSRRKDYFTINAAAHRFVSEVLKQELQYSLKYPRYYSAHKIIPLLASASQVKGEIPFTFSKVVLKLGCPSPFLVPTAANNCILNVKYEILSKRFPLSEIGDDKVHPSKQHISRDDVAHKLAASYEADVVISLSSLRTLMDNIFPKLEHDWEVPVIVCEDPGGTCGGPCKRVYVEKSIPPASLLSVRAKNELFYSYALKCKFTHTYPQKSRKHKCGYAAPVIPDDVKPVSEEEQAELHRKMSDLASFDDICEVSEKVCELDTFGISSPKRQPSKPKVFPPVYQNPVNNESQSSDKTTEDFKYSIGSDDNDDDDELLVEEDDPFIRSLKGMIMKSCTPGTASGASDKTAVANVDMESSGGKGSDFAQCLSPMSNAESEHDGLVIDYDSEGKKSDFSVSATPERKDGVSEEVFGSFKAVSSKICGLKGNEKISLLSEDEGDIGIKKHKVRPLPSEDNGYNGSNNSSTLSHKNDTEKPDIMTLKTKKLPGNSQFRTPLDQILVSQHKMLKPEDNINDDAGNIELPKLGATDPMDEIAKDYPPLSQPENVTYSLWHLGQLKILLRSEIDSQVSTAKCPNTPAFLFPKLEYQLMYGFEVTTPSELMKQWVLLYTHPGSHVVKVRINTTRSTLAMLEEVNLPNLPQDKKFFDPKRAIQQLHMILDTLKSLPEGQYLLVHRKGEQTLTLQKAVNTAKHGAFDLHSSIKQRLDEIDNSQDTDTTRKEVPWLPIDSSISLPEHKRDSRIPGCFYPIDFKRKRRNQNQQKPDKKTAPQKQIKNKGQAKKI